MGVCAKMLKNSSQRGQQQPLCQLPWQTIFKVSLYTCAPATWLFSRNEFDPLFCPDEQLTATPEYLSTYQYHPKGSKYLADVNLE